MTILPTRYAHIRWDEEHAQAWVDETFTWTNRETYLAWVAEWKADLKQRIAQIRQFKAIRRDKTMDDDKRGAANSQRQMLRIECANLFLLRQMGRKRSAAQRQQAMRQAA